MKVLIVVEQTATGYSAFALPPEPHSYATVVEVAA